MLRTELCSLHVGTKHLKLSPQVKSDEREGAAQPAGCCGSQEVMTQQRTLTRQEVVQLPGSCQHQPLKQGRGLARAGLELGVELAGHIEWVPWELHHLWTEQQARKKLPRTRVSRFQPCCWACPCLSACIRYSNAGLCACVLV